MSKKCTGCYHAVLQDHGYSNWTVEGTNVYCSKKLHSNDGFDRWYGENTDDNYANHCDSYRSGKPVGMDVDHEDYDSLSPDEKLRYNAVFGN